MPGSHSVHSEDQVSAENFHGSHSLHEDHVIAADQGEHRSQPDAHVPLSDHHGHCSQTEDSVYGVNVFSPHALHSVAQVHTDINHTVHGRQTQPLSYLHAEQATHRVCVISAS